MMVLSVSSYKWQSYSKGLVLRSEDLYFDHRTILGMVITNLEGLRTKISEASAKDGQESCIR